MSLREFVSRKARLNSAWGMSSGCSDTNRRTRLETWIIGTLQGRKVTPRVLHDLDTLYLKALKKSLFFELLRAHSAVKNRIELAASLAEAPELPAGLRRRYEDIRATLLPLQSALSVSLNGLETSADCPLGDASLAGEPPSPEARPGEVAPVLEMLDVADEDILRVMDAVGSHLAELSRSIIAWDECATIKVHVLLKAVPERRCYEQFNPIDLDARPFRTAYLFYIRAPNPPEKGRWPHYLVNEEIPLSLYPLIEDLKVELEVRGDGYASWRSREEDPFHKLVSRSEHSVANDDMDVMPEGSIPTLPV